MNLKNVILLFLCCQLTIKTEEVTSISNEVIIKDVPQDHLIANSNIITNKILLLLLLLIFCIFLCLISTLQITILESDELKLELKFVSEEGIEKDKISKIINVLSSKDKYWVINSIILIKLFFIICLILFLNSLGLNFYSIIIFSLLLLIITIDFLPRYIVKTYQLSIISKNFEKIITFLKYLTLPVTYFLGKLYSYFLGNKAHSLQMTKEDIKAFIKIQNEDNNLNFDNINASSNEIKRLDTKNKYKNYSLNKDEVNLMLSTLEIREKKVINLMIPFENTYTIDYEQKLDNEMINDIKTKGYSRIPVYSNHNRCNIIGLIRVKELVGFDLHQKKSLKDLEVKIRAPLVIHPNLAITDLLKDFQKGKSHMAFITEQVEKTQNLMGLNRNNSIINMADIINFKQRENFCEEKILGIVTLEDVIENMFGLKIIDEDEYDYHIEKNYEYDEKKSKVSERSSDTHLGFDSSKMLGTFKKKYQDNYNDNDNELLNDLPYGESLVKNDIII